MNKSDVNQPLVSAIITTHNRLDLLKRAVKSVWNQSYPNIELIVVDDCSDDGTEEWCENQQFTYIRIPKEESRGGNHARNLGIRKSKGELIAFLDDDDIWLPDKTENQVSVFSDPAIGVVFGQRITEKVNVDGVITYEKQTLKTDFKGDISQKVLTGMFTTSSLIMVKRVLLEKSGLFDEELKFWQDYELLIRLAQVAKFSFVNTPVTIYRVNQNDSGRLTNKYFGWKKAVEYIKHKHKQLYNNLTYIDRQKVKILIYRDAVLRCANSNLKIRRIWFKGLQVMIGGYVGLLEWTVLKKNKKESNEI